MQRKRWHRQNGDRCSCREGEAEHHSSRSLTWEQLVQLLFIVRRHRISEYEPKWGTLEHFHFCNYNITFFDFKRESNVGRGEPLHKLPSYELDTIMDSVNVISLKVVQSDVVYPINVYGTVIARDEIDYKCVYLFKRCRDDPQVIRSAEDMLTLTGPNRGLAVWDSMFFEVDLKIKGSGMVDKDFSKGVIEHNAARITRKTKRSKLISRLSEVELVFAPVPYAVEATLAVNILDGPFPFRGTLTAWTADNDKNHIILYDSEAPGTLTAIRDGPDGRSVVVPLSRSLVAVPLDEALMFDIWTVDGDHETGQLEKSDGKHDFVCGPYKVQVTVTWTAGITNTRQINCKWIRIGGSTFLL